MEPQKLKAQVNHIKKFAFEVEVRDHHQFTDAKIDQGGFNKGPNPKEYVLAGLCGCTSMDIVSLLNKFKVTYTDFQVHAETELTAEHPIVFKEVQLFFKVYGENIDQALFEKAVTLSMTRYCGVSAMLSKAMPIYYHGLINDTELFNGQAQFA